MQASAGLVCLVRDPLSLPIPSVTVQAVGRPAREGNTSGYAHSGARPCGSSLSSACCCRREFRPFPLGSVGLSLFVSKLGVRIASTLCGLRIEQVGAYEVFRVGSGT